MKYSKLIPLINVIPCISMNNQYAHYHRVNKNCLLPNNNVSNKLLFELKIIGFSLYNEWVVLRGSYSEQIKEISRSVLPEIEPGTSLSSAFSANHKDK